MSKGMKKEDLPAMPFYFGDWRKAPEVRAMELDTRMIWFEMLGFMWESTERGFLTICNKPVSNSVITRMLGIDITTFEKALKEMESLSVFSRREDGAIYCRKMVRDQEIRELRSKAGTIGMDKRYNKNDKPVITKPITNPESESEDVIKDNNKGVNFLFLEDLKKEMLNNFTQVENLARNHKISEERVKSFIEEFIKKLQNEDEEGKDFKDAKRHFANWLKIELNNGTTGTLQKTGIRADLSDKDYTVIV